ncbi:replication initiation protein RepC [Methylobacterium sp. C25]|uniref:plasmid replication protein RepC n=1 Tax=Methylobacterium sp. C25 TaxID=2721622 RepID=UPI001F3E067F|nr:plasmid replication protein RepC [Methylobacterium sp. C25]MCE4226321.1 replication initiation protein RepC [Methylobacterium sp. C25]
MIDHITTPFGRRSLTAAQIQAQANAAACPPETTTDKWAVVRHVSTARCELGLADRAIAILSALVSFYPETTLQAGEGAQLVVFPSNAQIRLRAHGIAETTLRYHLGALVEAGILIRRDSPNGKRYARKTQGGEIADAFGFDLTPLVARAAEFAAIADRIAAAERAERLAKERVSLMRRDLRKLIAWAAEAGAPGPWDDLSVQLDALIDGFPRRPSGEALAAMDAALGALLIETHKHLDVGAESTIHVGNASETRRHHQNSKPDPSRIGKASEGSPEELAAPQAGPGRAGSTYPLPMVLEACPDIVDYARGGVRTWGDLVDAADLVRAMLGISPTAWQEARDVMGAETAAVTVAAILQRTEHIRSPGGYLRSLVERKRKELFSLGPVLQALLRARAPAGMHAGREKFSAPRALGASSVVLRGGGG